MEKVYFIFYNGKPLKSVTDVNEQVKVKTDADDKFYNNKEVSFTIQELANGKKFDGISFDADSNIVKVELKALPIRKLYNVRIKPTSNVSFFTQKGAFNVYLRGHKLLLDNELNFALTGEANFFNVKDLTVEYNGDNKIVVTKAELDGQTLIINTLSTTTPNRVPVTEQRKSIKVGDSLPFKQWTDEVRKTTLYTNESKETEHTGRIVKLRFVFYKETFEEKFGKKHSNSQIPITAKIKSGDKLLKTTIDFHTYTSTKTDKKANILQSIVPLPSDWNNHLSVEITDGKTTYATKKIVDFKNGEAIVQFDNLEEKKKTVRISKHVLAALALLIGFTFGNCTGWWSGGTTSDSQYAQETDTTQYADEGTATAQADERMEYFKTVLNNDNKDLSFAHVAELYTEYSADAEAFKQVDADFCKVIESYHKVQEAFDNMDVDSLVKFIEYGNQEIKLFEQHRLPVAKYFQGNDNEGRRTYFITNKERIKTFADFNRLDEGWKNGQEQKIHHIKEVNKIIKYKEATENPWE